MKKVILVLICVLIPICGCSAVIENTEQTTAQPFYNNDNARYVKAVWITYYELEKLIDGKSEKEFENAVNKAFEELYSMGFNTVTIQVRAFADAIYKSDYFPVSKYCFGKQGSQLKFDVLEILCKSAKANGFNVEAWINPYRISFDNDIEKLGDNNTAKKWYKDDNSKSNVYLAENGIYFNPASEEVKKLIINGVEEIVKNYDISAIQFDDYFYPTKDKEIDKAQFDNKSKLGDFRRSNVSDLIKRVNESIKKINPNVRFIISPASDIEKNYNDLYADVKMWASDKDFCDAVCPQVYFGFKNVYQPFMFTVKKWVGICEKDLYIGLPLYKSGKKDNYAAIDDKKAINEFKDNKNIIARQINYLAKIDDIKGFYIFSYSSLIDEKNKEEVANLIKAIQGTHPNQVDNQ